MSSFVRVSNGTRIILSKPLSDTLQTHTHVLLLVDQEKGLIGIRPCRPEGNGYKVSFGSGQAYISARSLIGSVNAVSDKRIDAKWDDGMIQFSYVDGAKLEGRDGD